jgi:hypothetical protein
MSAARRYRRRNRSPIPLAVAARVMRRTRRLRCLLCNAADPIYLGIWIPTRPILDKLLIPADEARNISYRLCSRCRARPDSIALVEIVILSQAAELATSPTRN